MRNRMPWLMAISLPLPLWAPEDGTPPGGGDPTPPPGNAAPPAAPPSDGAPAPKWFEGGDLLTADERAWLGAKGLTLDDPAEAAAKLLRGHRSAEQFIGKGVEKIIERPADGQDYGEWARANAKALGLPDAPEGYDLAPPDSWPKDMPWDAGFEAQFREFAHKSGMPPAMAKAAVGIYAGKMQALAADADAKFAEANTKMMAELERDYGEKMPAVLARAKQGAQAIAEKAGFDAEALASLTNRITKDAGGDAMAIKFMAAIGELLGEDAGVGLGNGNGNGFGPTRADAEAALADFTKADGEWARASAARDQTAIARLRPKFDQLTKQLAAFTK